MDRTRVGFALVGVASLLWVVVNLMQGFWDAMPMAGLLLIVAGGLVAAGTYSDRPTVGASALGLIVLGIVMFYMGSFSLLEPSSIAGLLFGVGAAVAAVGVARQDRRWRFIGAVVAALGSALWIYADGSIGATEWQPGNILAAVAWTLVAVDSR